MVDYNQSLSVPEAIRRVQLLEEEALVWVEEPTRAASFLPAPIVGHAGDGNFHVVFVCLAE
jgi:FAD/FMN-containing dehydrogenase